LQNFYDYRLGYKSVNGESSNSELSPTGKVPLWLKGDLVRNGPAKYEIGNSTLNHWFDGFAMLHKFSFDQGNITYLSKFVESSAYKDALNTEKISSNEFATNRDSSLLEKLLRPFTFKATDNSNVNICPLGNTYLAMTETPEPIMFDCFSLSTVGKLIYDDQLKVQLTTAHPHFDFTDNTLYNVSTKLGLVSEYIIFKINGDATKRKVIATIPVKRPGYLHSFATTKNYVVLVDFPFTINPLELLFSSKPYIENYHWFPKESSRFFLINKFTGNITGPLETDPCFAFHHINAYEQDKHIVIDFLTYPDSSIIDSLYLSNLMKAKNKVEAASFSRFYVDTTTQLVKKETLFNSQLELPRINYQRFNTSNYRYVYAVGQSNDSIYLDKLIKLDLIDNDVLDWQEDSCFPGEAVYIPQNNNAEEDNGIVLSVVLNAKNQNSFLLMLDAKNMQELARATIPNIMPFGFHGQFIRRR
jgi:beta,beta-carotene 9',10'-dioxygenase